MGRGTADAKKLRPRFAAKVIEAIDRNDHRISIWGDGRQTRSFMYIDDCLKGIDMIMHCDESDRDADQSRFERARDDR